MADIAAASLRSGPSPGTDRASTTSAANDSPYQVQQSIRQSLFWVQQSERLRFTSRGTHLSRSHPSVSAMAASPSSSPRLPSPPPMAEDQIGPGSSSPNQEEEINLNTSGSDHGASRRIRPGTRSEDMLEGPPLVDLQDVRHPWEAWTCKD